MTPPDRIIQRPPLDGKPERWYFKTSEGLIGPFDSLESTMAGLDIFVRRCRDGAPPQAIEPERFHA